MRGRRKFISIVILAALLGASVYSCLNFDIKNIKKAKATEPAWPEAMADWKYRKKIHIDGSSAGDQSNYVMKLNAHYGDQKGHLPDTSDSDYENFIRNIKNDVYFNGKSQTDFDDVRFTTSGGTEIPAWKANSGNYEYIYDDNGIDTSASKGVHGQFKFIVPDTSDYETNCFSEGDLLTSFGDWANGGIFLSKDNGENWVKIASMQNTGGNYGGSMMFLDSVGEFYTAETRSGVSEIYSHTCSYSEGNYVVNATLELNLLDEEGVTISGGSATGYGWAEDNMGSIYFGRYNDDSGHGDGLLHPAIYKKTRGGSFALSYSRADNPTTTGWHIHGVGVDPTDQSIYAYVDGDYLLKSSDHGDTWDEIGGLSAIPAGSLNGTTVVFGPDEDQNGKSDYRLLGTENGDAQNFSILKTTDDENFTVVAEGKDFFRNLVRVEGTNTIYAMGTTSYGMNAYPQVIMSDDDGDTWQTIYISDFEERDTDGHYGTYNISNVGIPVGDDQQILIGGSPASEYPGARLYVGGEHYQGTFYAKIPIISEAGTDIYVYYGNSEASSTEYTSNDIYGGNKETIVSDGLVGWWKFDDYSGTNVPDQSGNGNTAVLGNTDGAGAYSIVDNDLTKIVQRLQPLNNPGTISSGSAKHLSLTRGTDHSKGGYATVSVSPTDGRSGNMGPTVLNNLTASFTLSAWVRGQRYATESAQSIIAKGLGRGTQFEFGIYENKLIFKVGTNDDGDGTQQPTSVYSTEAVVDTAAENRLIQHVGVTISELVNAGVPYPDYDIPESSGGDENTIPGEPEDACVNAHEGLCQYVTFWMDGRKMDTKLLAHKVVNTFAGSFAQYSNPPIRFGAEVLRNASNVYATFNGEIDEIRMYDRVLSQADFVSLFEMRPIAGAYPSGEPAFDAETKIDAENTRSEKTTSRSTLFKNVTNTINSTDSLVTYNTEPIVSDEVDLTITPTGGNIDVGISTWNTSGDYSKTWTETSTTATSAAHTIGDLAANTYYTVSNGSAWTNTYLSNSSGQISFTYDGGYSTHTFNLTPDTTAPTLTISSPSNSTSTTASSITITGTATDATSGLSSLTINSVPVTVTGGSFSTTVSLSLGSNTITLVAIDNAGNATTQTLTITRTEEAPAGDVTAPTIAMLSPSSTYSSTYNSSFTLWGQITDAGSGVSSAKVNNATVQVDSNGFFKKSVKLRLGSNQFDIVATDNEGNASTKTIYITRRVYSPVPIYLSTTTIQDGSSSSNLSTTTTTRLNTQTPTLKGKTYPYALVTIEIHSDPITAELTADQNGDWSYTPTELLAYGDHTVKITVKDPNTLETISQDEYKITIIEPAKAQEQAKSLLPELTPTAASATSSARLVIFILAMIALAVFLIVYNRRHLSSKL